MNPLLKALVPSCLFVSGAAHAEAFDFTKINATVAEALAEFSAQSDQVETLSYAFIPSETAVDEDRYALDLRLVVEQAPWQGRLEAAGKLVVEAPADREGKIAIAIDATYETDALAALKAKVVKVSRCDAADQSRGLTHVVWSRHCEYVERLADIRTVGQLGQMLGEKLARHQADVEAYSRALAATLASLGKDVNPDVKALLEGETKQAGELAEFFAGVRLHASEKGFNLDAPELEICPFLGLQGMHLAVTAEHVAVRQKLTVAGLRGIYAAGKPALTQVLHGLEAGETYAKKLIQLDAEVFTNLVMGRSE